MKIVLFLAAICAVSLAEDSGSSGGGVLQPFRTVAFRSLEVVVVDASLPRRKKVEHPLPIE